MTEQEKTPTDLAATILAEAHEIHSKNPTWRFNQCALIVKKRAAAKYGARAVAMAMARAGRERLAKK